MRKFNQSHELAAPAEQVIDLVTREDYLRFRYEDPRLLGFKLDIEQDSATAFACNIERVVSPGNKIPSVAKRMVGERFSVVQRTEWSRKGPPYQGLLRVTIPGMPGKIESQLTLVAVDSERCRIDNSGSIEVKIPLAGGQIERLLGGVAEETFDESMQSISDYIAQNSTK